MRNLTLLSALLLAMPAFAQDLATGDAIKAAVSDMTIQGSMTSSGPYAEFYAADGTIKGNGYTAAWSIKDDTMCFTYEGSAPDCWSVRINGDQVTWIKDGAEGGTGTIVAGNVNNF
ncbi:hypothetical protein [Tabrizicola sp.]|jgi:hypothetical protein|uniref:hypothetical protein n=1 Tax=Tabrizicola sp. TaxID=2005166 RepID=UPI003D2B3692